MFNYTDHLGNIRLRYTSTGLGNGIQKLEENHYYPFGLKHKKYNSYQYVFVALNEIDGYDLGIDPLPESERDEYQYKFQGQERQDELGLNWDSFKWRNYDYAIGRFFNIDPLTEEYNTWSPYVFSGNRVIDARELEGLEPHVLFGSLQEAAGNFGSQYNGYSINNKVEVGTQFYSIQTENGVEYAYASPVQGVESFMDTSQANDLPNGSTRVGNAHTHSNENDSSTIRIFDKDTNRAVDPKKVNLSNINNYEISSSSNKPSSQDMDNVQSQINELGADFQRSYVFTPSGLVYSIKNNNGMPQSNVNVNLSKTNPSDPKSVMPMNTNSTTPNTSQPAVLPRQIVIPIDK